MPVRVPARLAPLGLTLHVDEAEPGHILETPWLQYGLIGGIAVLVAAVVFLLGSRLSFGLTQDLRKLERVITRYGAERGKFRKHGSLEGCENVSGKAHECRGRCSS